MCVISLWKKARAILDQIIAVAVPIIITIITAAQVRCASVQRRRVRNEWTWIYNLMCLYKCRGGGSRAKSRYCLILNQWHPFSFFDMDHWNDMPPIIINIYLYKYSAPFAKSGQFWFISKNLAFIFPFYFHKISTWHSN